MPPPVFEHAFPTVARPQTHTLNRAATGISSSTFCAEIILNRSLVQFQKGGLVDAGRSVDVKSDDRVFIVLTWISENTGLNTQLNPLAPVSGTPIFLGICSIVIAASIKRQTPPAFLRPLLQECFSPYKGRYTHSMPCPCRTHVVPMPCR